MIGRCKPDTIRNIVVMPGTDIFVEGTSDAVALRTLAHRRGRDLGIDGVRLVVLHGVTNIRRHLDAAPDGGTVAGLCDAAEQRDFRLAFDRSAERLDVAGVFVCVPDLETELIRAVGEEQVLEVVARERESEAFRTLQRQPAHRDGAVEQQLHRFIGTKSGRKVRYARLLAGVVELDAVPGPLCAVLTAATGYDDARSTVNPTSCP